MLTLSTRIWISFVTVLLAGLILSYVISLSGQQVGETTRNLVSVQLPKLDLIKSFRSSITEHERLLYEYYSTTNRQVIWPKVLKQEQEFQKYLGSISESFSGDIMYLPRLQSEITTISHTLDKNLAMQSVDWDQARLELAKLTETGQQAENILFMLTQKIQNDAHQGAQDTQLQIDNIIRLVIVFTAFIIVAAMFVGFYTQANIRKTAKRRALAKFPERNPNPVLNLNWQGEVLFSNPAYQTLLTEIQDCKPGLTQLLPHDFISNLRTWQREHKSIINFEDKIAQYHLHFSLSLLPDLESCHVYIEDITERKKAQDQLKYQALHDVHTGLPNRRKFEDTLNEKISFNKPFYALFISIDRFKFITSSQGYDIGDRIIQHMGKRLQTFCGNLQKHIQTFRLEGEIFCILLDESEENNIHDLVGSIQRSMDAPLCVDQHRYYLNLSMGTCHYPQDGQSARNLITNGNAALNFASRVGDSWHAYDSALHADEQSWLPIEEGMRNALAKHQFLLHYQAKVDADSTQVKGAEALIRWVGEDGKMISPGMFIPVAEQTGLIIKIGQWVIEEGFHQAKRFLDNKQDIQLAINISARQFQHRHFLKQLQTTLEKSQADPSKIELEITESLIMENADHSIEIMKKLKDMGFALAIDDFGTGYSSLSYLKQFPIDTLKVDQAFVRHLESDHDDKNIVRAIVDLAKHLNLKTIAEGVETQGQYHFLKDIGCDYIQGFLFSKPDTVEKLIKPSSPF